MSESTRVTIYSKENCPKCTTAKNVSSMNGFETNVQMLDVDYTLQDLIQMGAKREMPQVEINGVLVGGLEDFKNWLSSN